MLDHISVEDFIYPAFILKNQEKKWSQDIKIAAMDEEERKKFRDYKGLYKDLSPEDREKYAPIRSFFTTRKGVKREFGRVMLNEEGHNFCGKAKKTWKAVFYGEEMVEWITESWMTWVETNNFGGH